MPFPPNKGEKIRAFHTLMHFRKRFDIHLGCCVDDDADIAHIAALRALVADLHVSRINPLLGRLKMMRGLLTGEALTVAYFCDAGLRRWVRETMARVKPAAVFTYSSNIAPAMLDIPFAGKRIVDLVDVDSAKFHAYAKDARFPMDFVYHREGKKIAALERRIAAECDASVFVSEAEAMLFRTLQPGHDRTVRAIGNGVDHAYFDPAISHEALYDRGCENFVFTGTMDYRPNIDAVSWFAAGIFPLIRRALPDAQFHIVGANPTPEVRRLAEAENVHVTGRVADVRPYLAYATVAVAPMRIARGIQNKVLEAMAMARPTVTTAQGLEGIAATDGVELAVADSAEDFAARCIGLAREPGGMGLAARAHVLARCDWDALLGAYDGILDVG